MLPVKEQDEDVFLQSEENNQREDIIFPDFVVLILPNDF
jgi:hypothetical protein